MDDKQRTNMGYNCYGQRSKAGGRRVTSAGIQAGEFSKCRCKKAMAGVAHGESSRQQIEKTATLCKAANIFCHEPGAPRTAGREQSTMFPCMCLDPLTQAESAERNGPENAPLLSLHLRSVICQATRCGLPPAQGRPPGQLLPVSQLGTSDSHSEEPRSPAQPFMETDWLHG